MLTSAQIFRPGFALRLRADALAMLLVALAVLFSMIVFSEPAVADVLMLGTIIGLPILGVMRFGTFTAINFILWLVVVGLGIAAAGISPVAGDAIKHQLITLFLLLSSVVIAGYVSGDPVARFNLIMWCYTGAAVTATVAALVGYMGLVPGTYDLFTLFGRARGTFKDPNVYGAALVPALAFIGWHLLRTPWPRAKWVAVIGAPLAIGLLLSFSRGAWFAALVAMVLLFFVVGLRGRRRADVNRYATVIACGTLVLVAGLAVLLQFEQVWVLLQERFSLVQSYDQGPEGRFGGQAKALALIFEHPLGIGTFAFRELHHHEEAHNVYLSMFLNAGWIGGLFYLASVLLTVLVGLRLTLRNGSLQGPIVVTVSAFVALALEGLIIDSDHWRHYFLVMGLLWGLVDAQAPPEPDRRREDLA